MDAPRDNPVKRKLLAGHTVSGLFAMEFFTPGLPAIAQAAGAQFVVFDMEHSAAGIDVVKQQVALCRGLDVAPMVRVPAAQYHFIARVLDAGAMGVLVPMVETAEQAELVVRSAHYPPLGRRGAAFAVAQDDYAPGAVPDKIARAHGRTLLMLQIETERGLDNLEAIAAVPGFDSLWIGFLDLSNFLGVHGDYTHPRYLEAIDRIVAAARRHGKVLGTASPSDAFARDYHARGFRMIAHGSDIGLLQSALAARIRALEGSRGAMDKASPSDALREAAAVLCRHRLAREPLERLDERLRPAAVDAAYDIQDELHRQLTAAGLGPVAGHKIGCTTAVMQAFLKISTPCAGGVFERTVHRSPAVVRHGGFVRVGVECEIVVRLGADLGPGTAHTRESVAGAVAACMAGMELVDARYADYTTLDTPTLVADDFFDAGCVLGPERTDWRTLDLAACEGVTRINGVEAGRGRGADVMGHPFEALAWLARLKAARGQWLRAGEFVFLGSVVETRWVSPGDRVVMDIAGLGAVEASFPA